MVTDLSWLLATMAQSAAALVAIVGGFLVSRVVALSSQRQGLEQSGRELEQQTQEHRERLETTIQLRREMSWDRFKDIAAYECAERYAEHGSLSLEWIVRMYPLRGATSEELLKMAGHLIQHVQQAIEHFENGGSIPDRSDTDRDLHIYKAVNNARSPGSSPMKTTVEALMVQWRRYDKLIDEERSQQADLSGLERARDLVRTEAARVAKPRGLWLAVSTFVYLTVVGVVVPVIGLAWRPVPSGYTIRWVLVSLFVTGLLALGMYLIGAIRQLSRH